MSEWRHIAISGELGSGKSSLARTLAAELGFDYLSTGAMQRAIAESLSLSTLDANRLAETETSIDDRIDAALVERGAQQEPVVFDSRLAWFFVPQSFKVHLLVDPAEGARRAMSRGPSAAEHYTSLAGAEHSIEERFASERRRFIAKYGIDIARLRNYDVVVDTTHTPLEEVAKVVLGAVADPAGPHPRVFLDGRRISVLAEAPGLLYARPVFVAPTADEGLAEHTLTAEEDEAVGTTGRSARDFIQRAGILGKHRDPGGIT